MGREHFRRFYREREFSNEVEYKKFVGAVRKRDKNQCRFPKCQNKTNRIQVHHIKTWAKNPSLRYNVSNGICLCEYHHKMIKDKEDEFAALFIRIIQSSDDSYHKVKRMLIEEEKRENEEKDE